MEAIYKLLSEVKVLPPAPQVLPKVLDALHHEQTTLEEVGEIIALDPALTAKLLHYCNSVYFAGREPVASVPEAIGRVGFQTIFSLVSAVTGSNAFKLPAATGVDEAQLWKHSLTTAFGCKFIAEDIDEDSNLLFTAGLLHDIGRVVLAQAKGAAYGQLLAQAAASGVSPTELEKTTYGFTHADVGACLMETWRLPVPLVQSVRFHHQPAAAGPDKRLAASVCVGNSLANIFEHPSEKLAGANLELQTAMELLGINKRHLELYDEQMQENWEFVNTLIQLR
jgi:putative nucleotidyltransferase with HDIG domain